MAGKFRVEYSGAIKARLKELHDLAAARGDESAFLQALIAIDTYLRDSADTYGELQFNLKHLQLEIRKAIRRPIVVSWGVHRKLPLAFLRHLSLLDS